VNKIGTFAAGLQIAAILVFFRSTTLNPLVSDGFGEAFVVPGRHGGLGHPVVATGMHGSWPSSPELVDPSRARWLS